MKLEGKTTIVTGAGTSIGRELALGFSKAGANVVCCGRRMDRPQETLQLIKAQAGRGLALSVDVTDRKQVQDLIQKTLDAFGQIDVLFNNAGSFQSVAPVWEADPDVWWQDVTTNLYGSMLCARAVLPHMMARDPGVIINMDGGGGSSGLPSAGSGYGCSKAVLLRFTEALARELETAGSSVMAFAMNPGFVCTEMTEHLLETPPA